MNTRLKMYCGKCDRRTVFRITEHGERCEECDDAAKQASRIASLEAELRKANEAIVRVQNMSPAEWSRVWCPFCGAVHGDDCNDGCTATAARARLTPEAERRGD